MKRRLITLLRIFRTGAVNFIRSVWLAIAAMSIMLVTLTIILFSIIANATFHATVGQITDTIDISIFLKDSVTPAQTQQLIKELKALPNTKSVTYLSKAQAAEAFLQQQNGQSSTEQALNVTGNPLPATIRVKPRDLNQIDSIRPFLNKPDIKAMESDQPSYSGDRKAAIDKIAKTTSALNKAGLIAVIVFAVISVLIIFNTIQMAIFNRRDEIQIMRLLGASTWFIRGPFIVESTIYGLLSGAISVLIGNALFFTASSSLQATSFGLLDISYSQAYFQDHYWALLALQLGLGILIGAISSFVATRRYLKFRTR